MNEFSIIKQFFADKTLTRADVLQGIGDDAALLSVPADQALVVTTDTLVAGMHFLSDVPPFALGVKALAVNLSDLASMGATPVWFTLALTMPSVNEAWLADFSAGLFMLAKRYNLQLIGGDTTQGPLAITISAYGLVPKGQAILRSGAKVGDQIYVSGTLGDAGFALQMLKQKVKAKSADHHQMLTERMQQPTPRIELGLLLRGLATSAIDISDGLLADLNHVLSASDVGAEMKTAHLPLSKALRAEAEERQAITLALTAGDDYELCFTVPADQEAQLLARIKAAHIDCTAIGVITKEPGIKLMDFEYPLTEGFEHFR